MAIEPGTYEFGPQNARLIVATGRTGGRRLERRRVVRQGGQGLRIGRQGGPLAVEQFPVAWAAGQ